MSATMISTFEKTIQKTNQWLEELAEDLGTDPQHAYQALRGALHALRDRLTVEEASDLGSQLPMLVRGVYYESWNPAHTPTTERDLHSFLKRIEGELNIATPFAPEEAARSVFRLLSRHCTDGQIKHVRSSLPKEIASLWGD